MRADNNCSQLTMSGRPIQAIGAKNLQLVCNCVHLSFRLLAIVPLSVLMAAFSVDVSRRFAAAC